MWASGGQMLEVRGVQRDEQDVDKLTDLVSSSAFMSVFTAPPALPSPFRIASNRPRRLVPLRRGHEAHRCAR